MATNRDSTVYSNIHVSKYIADARYIRGRAVPIVFSHTVVSGETGGASAGVQDTVNLCVLKADVEVVGLDLWAENLWASAGVNGTLQIGDSGDDDRYMLATELYTSTGCPIATERTNNNLLAFSGALYRPTSDTIVVAKYKVANPTVGKSFKGIFWVIPAV